MKRHRMGRVHGSVGIALWAVVLSALLAAPARATDTAFWKPYEPDEDTYALIHFDDAELAAAQGEIAKVEHVGKPAFEAQGKFGGAVKLDGASAVRLVPKGIFPGGYICIEAWVKLDRYPEREACVVFKPAVVDASAQYDPKVDRSKGFALIVDSKGALHLQTTNCLYGNTTRTSSPPGAVPLGEWVHVAGTSAGYPISHRRVYAGGKELVSIPLEWGQGLVVYKDEEVEPTPVYIGSNDKGESGLAGMVDEVRIHRGVFKLWPKDDMAWARAGDARDIPTGPPFFVEQHKPTLYLPLDGNTQAVGAAPEGLSVEAQGDQFPEGVRRKCFAGKLTLKAPRLLDLQEGSLEFWMAPQGVNNFSDRNRVFVGVNPSFIFYIFNGYGPGRPTSMYFPKEDGQLHFVNDSLGTEYHDGAWYHIVMTWRGDETGLYVNGEEAATSAGVPLVTSGNKGVGTQIQFNPYRTEAQIDEVYLYDRALLKEEAANCFNRYRNPGAMVKDVRLKPVVLAAVYMPSYRALYYRLTPNTPAESLRSVTLTLTDERGKELLRRDVPLSKDEQKLDTPDLGDGTYTLAVSVPGEGGKLVRSDTFEFVRKVFSWEKSKLGVTDEVYPPFTPVSAEGDKVGVVQRTHKMNAFGLWDSVVSKGREILAAPMSLRYTTAAGEGKWNKTGGKFTERKPNRAAWSARAEADALAVAATSSIEMDGCMKVEMELAPGKKPVPIEKLWIDIPLKASEAPLFHEVADGPRINYSGATPAGQGVVWDSTKARFYTKWLNSFVPYIWLGGEERGLAWFAESDRGWITAKDGGKAPIQEIVREGDRLILRVYLINVQATLAGPHKLVFGLQASPTKPMPENWRKKIADIPGGLAVVPWGGLHCAYQTPYRNDWQIVDKIVEARATGKVDQAWFEQYAKEKDPPPAYGTWPWISNVMHFAGRAANTGPKKPLTVYQEEMASSTVREEWFVFDGEWTPAAQPLIKGKRSLTPESIFRGGKEVGTSAGITFGRSYQDFGCWSANEWLKRGVSLYWDNTYPHVSYNFRTTAAYVAENGQVQPCLILWDQREYQKRVWNLLQQWRKVRPEPLEWVEHMTNTLVLPIHTWGTANLDHELGSDRPFAPDWLRTECLGLQGGSYPMSLYPVIGNENKLLKDAPEEVKARVEWAMRAVHEIQREGPLEKLLAEFGYGTPEVVVHNYWEERPALAVDSADVKWLALARPADGKLLIVLASWSEGAVKAQLAINWANLGLKPAGRIVNAESGEAASANPAAPFTVTLPGPYGVMVLKNAE